MKPTVLVATTARWFPTARLAMALVGAGFSVDVVCPARHPLRRLSTIRKRYPYDGLAPVLSFSDAVSASLPDLLIPGDEYAVRLVHKVYDQASRRGKSGEPVCELIERSLGPMKSFQILAARAAVMQLAQEESVRVPRTTVVTNPGQLEEICADLSFPLVLKADGTSSGEGVRIVRTIEEAHRAFRFLQAPPSAIRAAKRALIDLDMRSVMPVLLRQRNSVSAQEFIAGQDATSLVACWKGSVRACLHFEVVKKQHKNGPASVMRRLEHRELDAAISRIVGRLELSGILGFDFLLEKQSGHPYLIEINPRPTQVGHLSLGRGRDIPAALYAAVTGTQTNETQPVTEKDTIALFPQEWVRNPQSVFLRSAYHDIPWEEPELIRAGARKSHSWSFWYKRKRWATLLLPDRVPPGNE